MGNQVQVREDCPYGRVQPIIDYFVHNLLRRACMLLLHNLTLDLSKSDAHSCFHHYLSVTCDNTSNPACHGNQGSGHTSPAPDSDWDVTPFRVCFVYHGSPDPQMRRISQRTNRHCNRLHAVMCFPVIQSFLANGRAWSNRPTYPGEQRSSIPVGFHLANERWREGLDESLLSTNILAKTQVRRTVDEQCESSYPSK